MSSQRHHLNGTLRCGRIIQGRTAQSTTLSTAFICCSANDTRVSNRRCPVRCFIPVTFHDFNRPDNALCILPDLSATKSDPAPSQSDTREKTPADKLPVMYWVYTSLAQDASRGSTRALRYFPVGARLLFEDLRYLYCT